MRLSRSILSVLAGFVAAVVTGVACRFIIFGTLARIFYWSPQQATALVLSMFPVALTGTLVTAHLAPRAQFVHVLPLVGAQLVPQWQLMGMEDNVAYVVAVLLGAALGARAGARTRQEAVVLARGVN